MPAHQSAARHDRLGQAVHRHSPISLSGLRERLFTMLFRGLVYPQIWEDPEVDLAALAPSADSRIITIASGGCNVLSYLIADPREIVAVDLNRAHVALTKLKLAAAKYLPSYGAYYRFLGEADEKANITAYRRFLKDRVDEPTRRYWESRGLSGRRRISLFSRGLYRHGLFGRFIGLGHLVAHAYGIDPRQLTLATTLDEQRAFFETALAPLFDKRLVRWATSKSPALYGLGIPPAQFEALAFAGDGDVASVLRQRLERLACSFPLSENYFAWQAFGRSYDKSGNGPVPPYLARRHFDAVRARADRVSVVNRSFTEHLESEAAASFDAYVLLDAQDWMTNAQLNALWAEITRTARRGARAIFRTAAEPSILPGRLHQDVLDRWSYRHEESRRFSASDRSATYGGFHLYVLKD